MRFGSLMLMVALVEPAPLTRAVIAEQLEAFVQGELLSWQEQEPDIVRDITTDSDVDAEANVTVELTVGWEVLAIVGVLVLGSVAKVARVESD
jgi:hypothetical protein